MPFLALAAVLVEWFGTDRRVRAARRRTDAIQTYPDWPKRPTSVYPKLEITTR